MNIPNLDISTDKDLRVFLDHAYSMWFGGGPDAEVWHSLCKYVNKTLDARDMKLKGRSVDSYALEKQCDTILKEIPEKARW